MTEHPSTGRKAVARAIHAAVWADGDGHEACIPASDDYAAADAVLALLPALAAGPPDTATEGRDRTETTEAALQRIAGQCVEAEAARDERITENAHLAAALGRVEVETHREVDAPAYSEVAARIAWADGYTAACNTIRAAAIKTDETGGDDR